jgi:hypothetical protein
MGCLIGRCRSVCQIIVHKKATIYKMIGIGDEIAILPLQIHSSCKLVELII